MSDILFGKPLFKIVQNSLDAAALRQQVIADNIANVDTPGFKRSDVVFEKILQKSLDQESHFSIAGTRLKTFGEDPTKVTGKVIKSSGTSMRLDGNNVDIDAEMAELAENSLYYEGVLRQLSYQFQDLKTVISEGR